MGPRGLGGGRRAGGGPAGRGPGWPGASRRSARRSGKDPPECSPALADPKYQLSDDDREWVARTVDGLGPLTDRQRDMLALLLRQR
ncbi:MAG: hypothetical protein ACRDPY_21820 [Streptosporangiaceae bacterium]